MSDDEGDSAKRLYDYFIKTIKGYINQALIQVTICEGEAFVDKFLDENKKIKILIYWMQKIFAHLVIINIIKILLNKNKIIRIKFIKIKFIRTNFI
jgi:hypothetical protein